MGFNIFWNYDDILIADVCSDSSDKADKRKFTLTHE